MAAYFVCNYRVVNQNASKLDLAKVLKVFVAHGAEFLVADFAGEGVEGEAGQTANVYSSLPQGQLIGAFWSVTRVSAETSDAGPEAIPDPFSLVLQSPKTCRNTSNIRIPLGECHQISAATPRSTLFRRLTMIDGRKSWMAWTTILDQSR